MKWILPPASKYKHKEASLNLVQFVIHNICQLYLSVPVKLYLDSSFSKQTYIKLNSSGSVFSMVYGAVHKLWNTMGGGKGFPLTIH